MMMEESNRLSDMPGGFSCITFIGVNIFYNVTGENADAFGGY